MCMEDFGSGPRQVSIMDMEFECSIAVSKFMFMPSNPPFVIPTASHTNSFLACTRKLDPYDFLQTLESPINSQIY